MQDSDFQTFCCNGDILDVTKDIWSPAGIAAMGENHNLSIADMICCGLGGPQAGGLQGIPSMHTSCSAGSPTPLASLANTNTDNAALYRVTYTSASFGDNTVGDFIPTETPRCFWAYTVGAEMEEVTLPAPDITTLPPATTDAFGFSIETTTSKTTPVSTSMAESTGSSSGTTPSTTILSGTVSQSSSETSSTTSPALTPTPSGAVSAHVGVKKGYIYIGLSLVTMSLLWS